MNAFIVDTPHQVMNAVEARESLGLGGSHLIIIVSEQYGRQAFSPLLIEGGWERVHWVPISRVLVYLRRRVEQFQDLIQTIRSWRLKRIGRLIGPVDTVVVGNYLVDYMRHFAAVLEHRRIVLIDDGTATINVNTRLVNSGMAGVVAEVRGVKRVKAAVRQALVRFRDTGSEPVTFFTTYNFEARIADTVIKNEYKYLRSLASKSKELPEAFFLGMTVVEDGDLPEEKYISYMKAVRELFQGGRLVYIPHKREREAKVTLIRDFLGIEVRRFDVPIEYQMTVKGTRPRVLASFFSSALENCRVIFGDRLKIQFFYVDPSEFTQEQEFIRNVYAYFDSRRGPAFERVDFLR